MTELNLEGYIAQEAARVAADYNFYWTVSCTKSGLVVQFKTKSLIWDRCVTIATKDLIDWSKKGKQTCYDTITQLLEQTAEEVDNAEADYFAKKMCQKNFDWLYEEKA